MLTTAASGLDSAYPRHLEFKVGARTDENRTWYRKYVELSVRVPDGSEGVDWLQTDEAEAVTREGDDFYAFKLILGNAQINNLVREPGACCSCPSGLALTLGSLVPQNLSVGIIERSLTGATLWCTNLIVSDKGILLGLSAFLSPSSPFLPPLPPRCLLFPLLSLHPAVRTQDSHPRARAAGRHRKLIPTAAERVVWASSSLTNPPQAIDSPHPPTDNLPVVPTSVGRVGGVICWEHFNALTRYALYRKDVQVWVAPTADARPTWAPSMQFIAQEGRCFVVSANQFQRAADFPEDYPYRVARAAAGEGGDGPDEVWSRGGSCIVNPLGEILAGPLWDREGIVCAEVRNNRFCAHSPPVRTELTVPTRADRRRRHPRLQARHGRRGLGALRARGPLPLCSPHVASDETSAPATVEQRAVPGRKATQPLLQPAQRLLTTSFRYWTNATKFSSAPSARERSSGNLLRSTFLICECASKRADAS